MRMPALEELTIILLHGHSDLLLTHRLVHFSTLIEKFSFMVENS